MPAQITNDEDAQFIVGKIRDGTLTGDRKEDAFQALELYKSGEQVAVRSEPEKINFLQRVGNDLKERKQMFNHIHDAYRSGEQYYHESMMQVVGKVGAGALLDFVGEVLISGGRGLSAITPDMIEDPIKEGLTWVGHEFLNTKAGQAGLEAATAGVDKWKDFKEANPRTARNIESVVDIGLLAAPVKGKPKVPQTSVGKLGDRALASSETVAKKQRKEMIDDLVTPKKDKKVRIEEVKRTGESGPLKTKRVELSTAEKEIAEEVVKVKGVTSRHTLQVNYNAIAAEVRKESTKLKDVLAKNDFTFPPHVFDDVLDDVLLRLKDNPLIVGDAAKTATKIADKMKELVLENGATGSGLLKSRKQLDAWIKGQKGAKVFGGDALESSITIATRDVRQAANDFLIQHAKHAPVARSLQKQTRLLRAMENIAPKAADELGNVLLRTWHKGLKLLPLRGEFNQAMAAAWGVGGLGASAIFAPMFTKLAFGAIGSWAAYKYITGSASRRELGKLLKGVDKMIRTTKDANLIRELRADRALLLEVAKTAKQGLDPSTE